MYSTIGFTAILLALILSLIQPIFSFIVLKKKIQTVNISYHLKILQYFSIVISLLLLTSLLSLIYCYAVSDFSLLNVYQNSHSLKPLIYKISGSWGNHEGSMLLLVTILSFYGLAFVFLSKANEECKIVTISCQSLISFGLFSFICFTSNPFLEILPVPTEGLGLNPVLQDIGLVMHPPMLYSGYIGFSIVFSMTIAFLLQERVNKDFAKHLRPWLMFSWSFLTLGIGLGSWWAYRELGWGGFWFWDPVENVSLMPWLCATALIHCVIMLQKNGHFKIWTCFLAILSFIFCLLGIFLVRSGVLTSVHSFANDPARGVFIIFLLISIGGFGFLVFFFQSLRIQSVKKSFSISSRSGMVLLNNFLLCLALFIVALGTLYPLILQLFFNSNISIGPKYYQTLFAPISVVILCLINFIPSVRLNKFSSKSMALGHLGIFTVIISIALTAIFSETTQVNMKLNDKTIVSSYEVEFNKIEYIAGKNYLARQGEFIIKKDGQVIDVLRPQSRYYPQSDQSTTEAAIKNFILSDLYVVLGSKDMQENYAVRIYYKPFISFVWFGCCLMFIAGVISIFNYSSFKLNFNKKR